MIEKRDDMDFAHLHLHTQYSSDGVNSIQEYAEYANKLGLSGFAFTDHGNMFALSDLYDDLPVKVIPGCEVYVYDGEETKRHKSSHLTLIALDNEALRALLVALSRAHAENYYYLPRLFEDDLNYLSKYNIVCLSGCIVGYCAKPFLRGDKDKAVARIKRLSRWFGDRFYLELQSNPILEQERWNKFLVGLDFSRYVVTCDVHYRSRKDYLSYVVKVGGRANEVEPRFDSSSALWMQTGSDIYRAMSQTVKPEILREAVRNTIRILESANIKLEKNKWQVPSLPFPDRHLRNLVERSLKEKRLPMHYWERAEEELSIIEDKGFAPFFLLVYDLVRYARSQDFYVSNRGSAVGSLVLYLLGVTTLDPVKYNIPYWRFISRVREQPPDIDLDFEAKHRDKVLEYVKKTWGAEFVAQIANLGRYKQLLLQHDIKRAARRGWLPFDERDVERFMDGEETKRGEKIRSIFKVLENKVRFVSVHAGGIVISARPLQSFTHLYRTHNQLVAALDKAGSERLELMKLDLLVVDVLDTLRASVKKKEIDLFSIEPVDKKVYRWLNNNVFSLYGVFQLGTEVGIEAVKRLKPSSFEDLMAAISVTRPGSTGIEVYMQERRRIPQALQDILGYTNGALIYQEQQMALLKRAGFTDQEVERLIKLNKKAQNLKEHAEEYRYFIDRFLESDLPLSRKEKMNYVNALVRYGFNRAHAASYAYLCYLTLWAKTYYYLDYMLACLNHEKSEKKQRQLIGEIIAMGYKFLPPHVNHSQFTHIMDDGSIRLGLSSIKGIGPKVAHLVSRYAPYDRERWDKIVAANKRVLNVRVVRLLEESGALEGIIV